MHSGASARCSVKCALCEVAFVTKLQLRRHQLQCHQVCSAWMFRCATCSRLFITKQECAMHTGVHSGARRFQCQACRATFKDRTAVRYHFLAKHSNGARPFRCRKCPASFTRCWCLQSHAAVHLTARPHQCELCMQSFKIRNALYRHRRTIHGQLRPVCCARCAVRFTRKEHLRHHLGICHSKVKSGAKPLLGCCICAYATMSKPALQKHCGTHLKRHQTAAPAV